MNIIDREKLFKRLNLRFRYFQRKCCQHYGDDVREKTLEELFHMGRKSDLKNLISSLFINICLGVDGSKLPSFKMALAELAHYGKIFLDVNGLKSTNDWAGHEKGDIELIRIVKALTCNKAVVNFIQHFDIRFPRRLDDGGWEFVSYHKMVEGDKKGFFFQLFREGGDEFSKLIYCKHSMHHPVYSEGWEKCHPDNRSVKIPMLQCFCNLLIDRLSMIYKGNLVDYKCVINNAGEFGRKLFCKTGGKFVFRVSVAGAGIAFDQVLEKYLDDHVNMPKYSRFAFGNIMMGSLQNLADEICGEAKREYKDQLVSSDDPCHIFEGFLIMRSDEVRRMYEVMYQLEERLNCMVSKFCDYQQLLLNKIEGFCLDNVGKLQSFKFGCQEIRNILATANNCIKIMRVVFPKEFSDIMKYQEK